MEIIKIIVGYECDKKSRDIIKLKVSDVKQFDEAYQKALDRFNFTLPRCLWGESELISVLKSIGYLERYRSDILGFDVDNLDFDEYVDMILYMINHVASPDLIIQRYETPKYYIGGDQLYY